jgi:hypothetical protein
MSSESWWLGFQHTSDVLGDKRLRVRKLNAGGSATTKWYITLVNYQSLTRLKSKAVGAFKAAAENEPKKLREIMINNARELSMGQVRNFCEEESITVPYYHAWNAIAERTIGVPCAQRRLTQYLSTIGRRPKHWEDIRHMRWFTGQSQMSPICVHLVYLVSMDTGT